MVSVDFRFICDGERKKKEVSRGRLLIMVVVPRLVTPLARPHLGAPKLILKRLVLLLVFIIESVHKRLCLGSARRRRRHGAMVVVSSMDLLLKCCVELSKRRSLAYGVMDRRQGFGRTSKTTIPP